MNIKAKQECFYLYIKDKSDANHFLFLKTDKNSTKEVKMTIKRAGKRLHTAYGNAFQNSVFIKINK